MSFSHLETGLEPVPGYTLIERLGRGGFGEVWKASGPGGFKLGLKFVQLVEKVGPLELRALEIIKDIRHPHLLATFGAWKTDDFLIIAMELAERTLMDRFREACGQGLPGIPPPQIWEYFLDAAQGLDYLNEPRHHGEDGALSGIQHRDVKPQNLLLVGGRVKVADFGLSRVLNHTQTGHTGSLTPAYAAPEFFDGRTSSQSDQYSLAAAYCHMRGGRLPFSGGPSQVMAGHLLRPPDLGMLPESERASVARALEKEPKRRWESCQEFMEAVGVAAGFLAPKRRRAWDSSTGSAPEVQVAGSGAPEAGSAWETFPSVEMQTGEGSASGRLREDQGLDTENDLVTPDDEWDSAPDDAAMPPAYAGAWRRMAAAVVDNLLHALFFYAYLKCIEIADMIFSKGKDIGTIDDLAIPAFFLSMVVMKSIMYASRGRATFGMRWMGIEIASVDLSRPSFMRSIGRELCKFLSILPLFSGYLLVFTTARKQALHDLIAGTLIIKARGGDADELFDELDDQEQPTLDRA